MLVSMESALSQVATSRCGTYAPQRVQQSVSACVESLPALQRVFAAAQHVLLKPNLLSCTATPDEHVNTHPALVQSVAHILRSQFGCAVAIGDSCASLHPGATEQALRRSGMYDVARATGAEIYNVDAQPRCTVAVKNAEVLHELTLPANLEQFDLIVSLPKLKTHQLTYITAAVKNMLGLMPAGAKRLTHALAPRLGDFAALLCDLFSVVRPGAAVLDGVVGMEGRGPSHGRLRDVELIAASADPVALDSVCAQVMGFNPQRIPLLRTCERRALGHADPQHIEVVGEPPSAFQPPGFKRPSTYAATAALSLVPRWAFSRAFTSLATPYADVNQSRCRRCGECARTCPSEAIVRNPDDGSYRVLRSRCISCFCCDEVCPYDAIDIGGSIPRRILKWFQRGKGDVRES